MSLTQRRHPESVLLSAGDAVTFILSGVPDDRRAAAFLRTNLGMAGVRRRELVGKVEKHAPPLGRDWHDVPMKKVSAHEWEATLPLTEVGAFAAKCFVQREGSISWAEGENFQFRVTAAVNLCCNRMYSAFVRQFGPNMARPFRDKSSDQAVDDLTSRGFVAIPRSGTFRRLAEELDFIIGELGFSVIQLLPVHPTPVSFGRMGVFGSPFAATDYFSVDPQLAEFDRSATPMDQFSELIDAVHLRRARIFMDIPVNHTGWASRLQSEHPEWFVRDGDGAFQQPGAWGVVWGDLCKLDYSAPGVWREMAEVFLFWCRKGVDGFRCDAGYMLPEAAWEYIVARVREHFPETVFLLEGLGGSMPVQERLLAKSGLDWAYSELFQNYDRDQIEYYYGSLAAGSRASGLLVNYAETHDNTRLAVDGKAWSLQRCVLSAMLSDAGAFGITNGVEFLARERVDVHLDSALNWGAAENIVPQIKRLNRLLAGDPCFFAGARWRFVHTGGGNAVAVWRESADEKHKLLCLFNLNRDKNCVVSWSGIRALGLAEELFGGVEKRLSSSGAEELEPLGFRVYRPKAQTVATDRFSVSFPAAAHRQMLKAAACSVWSGYHPNESLDVTPDALADSLYSSCADFLTEVSGVCVGGWVDYSLPIDLKRQVMVFSGGLLAVTSDRPFRVEAAGFEGERLVRLVSVEVAGGRSVAFVRFPIWEEPSAKPFRLNFEVLGEGGVEHLSGVGLLLPCRTHAGVKLKFHRAELLNHDRCTLLVNDVGGYSQMFAAWGELRSKYDAILAANCHASMPVDRFVMFTRCRAWVVCRDYSAALDTDSWEEWSVGFPNAARWEFSVPVGQGRQVTIVATVIMARRGNAVRVVFSRRRASGANSLPDGEPVKLILRPDLEDRCNHAVTKAFTGAERLYPRSVRQVGRGAFEFAPAGRKLEMSLENSGFVSQPEWQYMVALPREKYYGLEDHTDLFSPGYFETTLEGGGETVLSAEVKFDGCVPPEWGEEPHFPERITLPESLRRSIGAFIVRRGELSTVIAGYPWFLDWGRDTLICLRGMISSGRTSEALSVIRGFAAFEENGTIPNMIHGHDVSNRDTTDAPLWLIVAVADLVRKLGSDQALYEPVGHRRLLDVMASVVENYIKGTPNGICADPESMLVYSPPHFTWMDTNYPAATPREGYPVEIQALWYAALNFLSRYFPRFAPLAEKVGENIRKYFVVNGVQGLSDCLHTNGRQPAAEATADNAVRPNQLLAVTLGAVVDRKLASEIIHSTERLLVPGAIRSLADAEVFPPLPVRWHGALLNDPARPYRGHYRGSEDTERKVAYHNGTAWCWQFPLYVEALFMVGGRRVKNQCFSYLNSAQLLTGEAVPWMLPEVADGDYPHHWGGCSAQAWSTAEFLRVWLLVDER